MKFRLKLRMAALIVMAVTSVMMLNSCNDNDGEKCCEGYTGKITDPRADSLVNRCHFLSKDSIEIWVSRYEGYQKELMNKRSYKTNNGDTSNTQGGNMSTGLDNMSTAFLMGGSVSYNSCILRKIISDKNSIGMRVLYGIDGNNKMHIILVGVKFDYSNLYVSGDDCCDKSLNKSLGASLTNESGVLGGAEYGQMP